MKPKYTHSPPNANQKNQRSSSHQVYRPRDSEFQALNALVEKGQPTLLAGPTGCGKTTAVESLNRPMLTVIGGTLKNPQDLLGRFVLKRGESEFIDGALLVAMDKGHILYVDEVHEARPESLSCLKSVTDHRRCISVNGQVRAAHPSFCVVAAGMPPFRNMSPELRQRFTFVPFDYLPAEKESDLIMSVSRIPRTEAEFLVRVGDCTRRSLQTVGSASASTRALLQVAQGMVDLGWSRDQAVDQLLWKLAECQAHQAMLQVLISAGLYSRPAVPQTKEELKGRDILQQMLDDDEQASAV